MASDHDPDESSLAYSDAIPSIPNFSTLVLILEQIVFDVRLTGAQKVGLFSLIVQRESDLRRRLGL